MKSETGMYYPTHPQLKLTSRRRINFICGDKYDIPVYNATDGSMLSGCARGDATGGHTLNYRDPLHRNATAAYPELQQHDTIILCDVFFRQDSLALRYDQMTEEPLRGGGVNGFHPWYDARSYYPTTGKAHLASLYHILANATLSAFLLLHELLHTQRYDGWSAGITWPGAKDYTYPGLTDGPMYGCGRSQLVPRMAGPEWSSRHNDCYICYIIEMYAMRNFNTAITLPKREYKKSRLSLVPRDTEVMPGDDGDDPTLPAYDRPFAFDTSDYNVYGMNPCSWNNVDNDCGYVCPPGIAYYCGTYVGVGSICRCESYEQAEIEWP